MSSGQEYMSKEELVEWVKRRLSEIEEEARALRSILTILEGDERLSINESVEEIKVGRRRVARIFKGEDYVRLVPDYPLPLPKELKEYLAAVIEDLRELQSRQGVEAEEAASLVVRERPDGGLVEVRINNLYSTVELLKAKAALKYVAEVAYQVYRLNSKGEVT